MLVPGEWMFCSGEDISSAIGRSSFRTPTPSASHLLFNGRAT